MRWKRGAKVGQRPLNQFLLCDPGVVSFKHTVIMVCRSTGFTNFRCLFDCSRLFEKLQFFLQDCQNDLGIVAQFAVFFAAYYASSFAVNSCSLSQPSAMSIRALIDICCTLCSNSLSIVNYTSRMDSTRYHSWRYCLSNDSPRKRAVCHRTAFR